jgi:hypothetical protein
MQFNTFSQTFPKIHWRELRRHWDEPLGRKYTATDVKKNKMESVENLCLAMEPLRPLLTNCVLEELAQVAFTCKECGYLLQYTRHSFPLRSESVLCIWFILHNCRRSCTPQQRHYGLFIQHGVPSWQEHNRSYFILKPLEMILELITPLVWNRNKT